MQRLIFLLDSKLRKMLNELQGFYISQEEPTGSCLLALRSYILGLDPEMSETWTHKLPMFRLRGKLFCYLWIDKKTYQPYVGMYDGIHLNHPSLDLGNRNKMKTIHIDPAADLPMTVLNEIFKEALAYRNQSS